MERPQYSLDMCNSVRNSLAVKSIVFALLFCLTAQPTLNAPDSKDAAPRSPHSLAESLFHYASELGRGLHERPMDERSASDYRRAMDVYGQVIRLGTDSHFSAESLARMAELQREMADATGDSALYQQAVETLRKIAVEHPQSTFVSNALVSIAQIYEENLQDLDGAAAAYRELIRYFPSSVMAREAHAVLARFEAQLRNRPVDVLVSSGTGASEGGVDELLGRTRLTNVRNFSGADYARVVIDLSGETRFTGGRTGNNRLGIQLSDANVSTALYGRRFIVGESGMLKRIVVSESGQSSGKGAGVKIEIEVSSLSDYSVFQLSDPERIVIDLHATGAVAKTRDLRASIPNEMASSSTSSAKPSPATANESAASGGLDDLSAARRTSPANAPKAILGLPEITDPILPFNPADAHNAGAANPAATPTDAATAAIEARAASGTPVKCVVIDPGHGGHDTGTISENGLREKDLVLDVARRLRAYVKRAYPDIEVVLTRDSDRYVALEERTAIANSRRADLFISVHANASPSRAASGVETFFLSPDRASSEDMQAAARENARLANDSKADKLQPIVASVSVGNRVAASRELARYIQSGLVRGIGAASPRTASNRGVKHAPFVVLLGAAMPSVLAEVSFLSNPRDEALLKTSQFRERIAASLFAGLNAYLKKSRAAESKPK